MQDTLNAVAEMTGEQLDLLIQAITARRANLRKQAELHALATLAVGDKVALTGLKPKYINGATGVITRIDTKIHVRLDDGAKSWQAVSRFGHNIGVPASCLVKVDQ